MSDSQAPAVSDVLRDLADERHTIRLTVEDGILFMKVLCPFDETDTERPCWPTGECLELLPGPKQECVYIGWCENLAPDEFAAGMVSFDCAVRWDWSDGDGPQAELHEPSALRGVADENDRLREALHEVYAHFDSTEWPPCETEAEWRMAQESAHGVVTRALLAVPVPTEECATCGGTREVPDESYTGPYDKKFVVPCPVCAVPTEPTEEA